MNRRCACVFETTRSWHLRLDGQEHDITARWEGILRGKLVVLVDGELTAIYERDRDAPMDPYGNFQLQGHELEIFPACEEWSVGQSMNLSVDGEARIQAGGSSNLSDKKTAAWAAFQTRHESSTDSAIEEQ
jgi:hypothetical protein